MRNDIIFHRLVIYRILLFLSIPSTICLHAFSKGATQSNLSLLPIKISVSTNPGLTSVKNIGSLSLYDLNLRP